MPRVEREVDCPHCGKRFVVFLSEISLQEKRQASLVCCPHCGEECVSIVEIKLDVSIGKICLT